MPVCPKLPLSPAELRVLDEHRSGIIPAFTAALNRPAPDDWKAYYRYCLDYLADDTKTHGPEAKGRSYIDVHNDKGSVSVSEVPRRKA